MDTSWLRGGGGKEKRDERRGSLSCHGQRDGERPFICKWQCTEQLLFFFFKSPAVSGCIESENMNRRHAEDSNVLTHPHENRFRENTPTDWCLFSNRRSVTLMEDREILDQWVWPCICFSSQPQNHCWTEVATHGGKKGQSSDVSDRPSGNMWYLVTRLDPLSLGLHDEWVDGCSVTTRNDYQKKSHWVKENHCPSLFVDNRLPHILPPVVYVCCCM